MTLQDTSRPSDLTHDDTGLLRGRDGLRVIADVHANLDALRPLLDDADANNLQPFLLGDLVDRGPDAPGVVRTVLARGIGFVPGNHDNKFARWYAGNPVTLGDDLTRTIAQFRAEPDGERLMADYVAAVRAAPYWVRAGTNLFVHAAFDLTMLGRTAPTLAEPNGTPRWLRDLALTGETQGERNAAGYIIRTYRWIDQVPAEMTVWVGHDVLSTDRPVVRTNAQGGTIINLDTGADRGGPLSYADIPAAALAQQAKIGAQDPAPTEPLLTVMVGPSGAGKSSWIAANAPTESVVSSDMIREELYGDFREQGDRNEVMRILAQRARARLAAGLPVVVDATHLSRRDRMNTVSLVPPHHPVRYVLIDRPLETKLRDAGWRHAVVLDPETGKTLVEVHHERAQNSFQHAAAGDDLPNVIVEDRRRR